LTKPRFCDNFRHESLKLYTMISKTCQYAVRAMIHLAGLEGEGFFPTRELAENSGTTFFFLGKILGRLRRKGLVRSQKGPRGGVKLGRPPGRISLLEIVEAVDGPGFKEQCFLGLPGCGRGTVCAVHGAWAEVREAYVAMLATITLKALAEERKKTG